MELAWERIPFAPEQRAIIPGPYGISVHCGEAAKGFQSASAHKRRSRARYYLRAQAEIDDLLVRLREN
jgi:hypothetical protein